MFSRNKNVRIERLDWKSLGQSLMIIFKVIMIIIENFKDTKVELEILSWLADEGKDDLAKACKNLAAAYKGKRVVRGVIDLNQEPMSPYWNYKNPGYTHHKISVHTLGGIASIENRPEGLFVDGRKVVLCRTISEIKGREMLTATYLDFLFKFPKFIPNEWLWMCENEFRQERASTILYFAGTMYKHDEREQKIRILQCENGELINGYSNYFGGSLIRNENCDEAIPVLEKKA